MRKLLKRKEVMLHKKKDPYKTLKTRMKTEPRAECWTSTITSTSTTMTPPWSWKMLPRG